MTNDLTTLSGALLEMKDQLIYELGQKGVTASYDSTTGLLGLIGKIGDIQTGSSCYHIEFSEDSYVAVGGSATLEIMLQSNYQPLSGATVTVTGSDSSLYTGITDSTGLATVTVIGLTSDATFTASYSNVTATCTVTVPTYVFYDTGVSGTANTNYVKSNTGVNAVVSSTGTTVSSTRYADCFYIANVLLPNDWIAEFTIVSVNAFGGIGFLNSSQAFQWSVEYNIKDSPMGLEWRVGSTTQWISNDYTMPSTIKLKKQGTSLEIYLNNTLIATETITDITGYLGWKTHSHSSRSVTFKDFEIRE